MHRTASPGRWNEGVEEESGTVPPGDGCVSLAESMLAHWLCPLVRRRVIGGAVDGCGRGGQRGSARPLLLGAQRSESTTDRARRIDRRWRRSCSGADWRTPQ